MGASLNTDGKKPFALIIGIGALLLFFVVSIATISQIGLRMSEQHAPLVNASMEIKYNVTLFHLWFEEIVLGDTTISAEETWAYLDEAEWYARAMIEGGENSQGRYVPLDNPVLRGQVLGIFSAIRDFRFAAHKRLENLKTSGAGSAIDQAFDAAFEELLKQADDVEAALQTSIAGDLKWYRIISAGLFLACIVIAIAVFFAITFYERRRRSDHASLERSEKHLATTLDSIGDAVIATDTKGFVTRMNPVAEEMTGWTAREALGEPLDEVFEIYHGKTDEKVESPVDRVLREGTVAGLGNHTVLVSRSGKKRHISDSASPIRGIANKLSGVVMVFRDETDKYAVTEALKDSEERFRETVNNAADGIITIDGRGVIESFNPSAETIFGYMAEEMIGQNVNMLMPEPYHSEHNGYLSRYLSTGEAIIIGKRNRQVSALRKGGSAFPMEVSINQMTHGHAIKFIAFMRDISERKRVEDELESHREHLEELVDARTCELAAANERLQELDKLKSLFIASMSHELRTPLNSIIGFSGILLQGMDGQLNAQQSDHLGRVKRSARHLLALITDVIDISKIEAGKVDAYVETFMLHELVEEAVSALQVDIAHKGLALKVDVPALELHTDRKRLLQCLLNYISNASKFTETGKIAISAAEEDAKLLLSVKDSGIGIRKKDMSRLFTQFSRFDSPLVRKTPGTGLGLYLTKKLVMEVLQGEVFAKSALGKGSTFSLRIPMRIEATGGNKV